MVKQALYGTLRFGAPQLQNFLEISGPRPASKPLWPIRDPKFPGNFGAWAVPFERLGQAGFVPLNFWKISGSG